MILFRSKYRTRIERKVKSLILKHIKIKAEMSDIRLSNPEAHTKYFRLMSESGLIEHDINLLKELLKN